MLKVRFYIFVFTSINHCSFHVCYHPINCLRCSVFSDDKDLLEMVAELKHAHRKLNEQNSNLLRSVAQCEDMNLQLTLEVTELRAKLAR